MIVGGIVWVKGVCNCFFIVGIEFEFCMFVVFILSFDCCDKYMMYVCFNFDFVSMFLNVYGCFVSLFLSFRYI